MKTLVLAMFFVSFGFKAFAADTPPTPCYDADSDKIFQTTAHITVGTSLGSKIPEIQYTKENLPVKIIWVDLPTEIKASIDRIGNYHGKEIYRIIYRKNEVQGGSLFCVVFAYQTIVPEDYMQITPFFISRDEEVRWTDSWFSSSEADPFTLEIQTTIPGTGVFTTDYSFAFDSKKAFIMRRSESGRNTPTKTTFYKKTGEILRTDISKDN